jgi:hypothetical protein
LTVAEKYVNTPSEPKIDGRELMQLSTALGYLPGVKPRRAAEDLVRAYYRLIDERIRFEQLEVGQHGEKEETLDLSGVTVDFFGHPLSMSDFEGLAARSDFGSRCITPKGVLLLIKLYQEGAFERKKVKKGLPEEPSPALHEYAAKEAELLAKSAARRKDNADWLAKRDAYLENPASVPEAEFSYSLLNALFFKHHGPGSATMDVGGLRVTRGVATDSSNLGKIQESTVVFRWTSADGQSHELSKES